MLKLLRGAPGITGLQEDIQVLLPPAKKVHEKEGVLVDKLPEFKALASLSFQISHFL